MAVQQQQSQHTTNSQKKPSPNSKKHKTGIKKLAKGLVKKARHGRKADDNEALIDADHSGTGNQSSGRSIEVLPGEEVSLDCTCLEDDVGSHDEAYRGYCDVCGGIYGRRSRRQRHVRFSSELNTFEEDHVVPGKSGKKKKKHKKLKKAKKVTWKVVKKSWKYVKVGLQMLANGPVGVATGSVTITNIVNNPTPNIGKPYSI